MKPIEGHRLQFYKDKIGAMTSKQALELSIEAEQLAKDCGPFDMAYPYMLQQHLSLYEYAILLEIAGE